MEWTACAHIRVNHTQAEQERGELVKTAESEKGWAGEGNDSCHIEGTDQLKEHGQVALICAYFGYHNTAILQCIRLMGGVAALKIR